MYFGGVRKRTHTNQTTLAWGPNVGQCLRIFQNIRLTKCGICLQQYWVFNDVSKRLLL